MPKVKGLIFLPNYNVNYENVLTNEQLTLLIDNLKEYSNLKKFNYIDDKDFNNNFNKYLHYFGRYINILLLKRSFSFQYDETFNNLNMHIGNKLNINNIPENFSIYKYNGKVNSRLYKNIILIETSISNNLQLILDSEYTYLKNLQLIKQTEDNTFIIPDVKIEKKKILII